MHKMLLGIEHLMTGVQFAETRPEEPPIDNGLPPSEAMYTFHQESPSIVCVVSDKPFDACWPVYDSFINSTPCTPEEEVKYKKLRYGRGEAEWWAQVAGEALRQTYHLPTASIISNQPPDAVIRAMRRKHGKEADKYIQQLRWVGMNKCWFYTYAGMYLGVEQDGYIHC